MTKYIGLIIDGAVVEWYDDQMEFVFIPPAGRIIFKSKGDT